MTALSIFDDDILRAPRAPSIARPYTEQEAAILMLLDRVEAIERRLDATPETPAATERSPPHVFKSRRRSLGL